MDKTLDLDELERVAREATPGPWMKHDHEGPYSFDKPAEWVGYAWVGFGGESDGRFQGVVADLDRRKDASPAYRAQAAADAKHIATFDPPTILTLIAAARPPGCVNHDDRARVTNLDGDNLCQECADAWVRAEGQWQAGQSE